MIDNKDFEQDMNFVREKFAGDGLAAPDALSEDALRQKLSGGPATRAVADSVPQKVPGKRRRWTRPLIGLAACAVLVICLIPVMKGALPSSSSGLQMEAGEDGLYHFQSYRELDKEMKYLLPDEQQLLYAGGEMMDAESAVSSDTSLAPDADMAVENKDESAPAAAGEAAGRTDEAPAHSDTYTQVEGIDEADIVKTDGNYIYYLSSYTGDVIIAKASNGKASRVSSVSGSKAGSFIYDLYVKDDQLIVIGQDRKLDEAGFTKGAASEATAVIIYDISDRTAPKEKTRYSQTGALLSSRLIGDQLCLVTSDMAWGYKRNMNVPFLCYDGGKAEKLPIENISCFPEVSRPSFSVVSMLDLSAGALTKKTVRTKAVLGGSDQIYCSGKTLYLTGAVYTESEDATAWGDDSDSIALPADPGLIPPPQEPLMTLRTQIAKVSLDGGKIRCSGSAIVDGTVNNQFSMDERDGTFRIATTSNDKGADFNNLYLFDGSMREVGCVIGFARGEHIEAVRYIKDKAYVITYEQTDPLFIIDLADPENPVIEGHVKISGFSTLLVPADDDHLLGLGFSTDTTEFGEATDGVKLALFDISDPSHPEVSASKEYPGMYSEVQYDHKALLAGPDGAYYAIPYELTPETWTDDDMVTIDESEDLAEIDESAEIGSTEEDGSTADSGSTDDPSQGLLVFSAKDGKLEQLHDFKTGDYVNRCIYIGDWLYGICADDSIEGFQLK